MKKTAYDYLKNGVEELTVQDTDYDMQVYLYPTTPNSTDVWELCLERLAKILVVQEEINNETVTVNFSALIKPVITKLKEADLFVSYNLANIICDLPHIISGFVSEAWINDFVTILEETNEELNVQLFSLACGGETEKLEKLSATYNLDVSIYKFGRMNSIFMGAFRNRQFETCYFLIRKGIMPLQNEMTEILVEFQSFYEKAINNI